jgi:hypothetical protein
MLLSCCFCSEIIACWWAAAGYDVIYLLHTQLLYTSFQKNC